MKVTRAAKRRIYRPGRRVHVAAATPGVHRYLRDEREVVRQLNALYRQFEEEWHCGMVEAFAGILDTQQRICELLNSRMRDTQREVVARTVKTVIH